MEPSFMRKYSRDSGADMTHTERDESETSLKNCGQPHALKYLGNQDQDKTMPGNRQSDNASECRRREQPDTLRDGETSSGSEILGPYRPAFPRPKRQGRKAGGHIVYYKPTINHYTPFPSMPNGAMPAIDEYCYPPPSPCQERVYHYASGNTSSPDDGYMTNAALRRTSTSDGYSSHERRNQNPGDSNPQVSDKGVPKRNSRTKEEVYGQIFVNPNSIPPIPKPTVQKQVQVKFEMIDNDGKKQTLHGFLACTSLDDDDDDPIPKIDPEDIGPSPHYQVPRNIPVNQTNASSERLYAKVPTPDGCISNRAFVQQEEKHGQTNTIAQGRTVPTSYNVNEKRERQMADVMNIRRVSGEYNETVPQYKPTPSNKPPKKHKNTTAVSRSVPDMRTDVIQDTSFWQKIGLGKKSSNGSHVCPTGELVLSIVSEEKVIEVKHLLRKHGCVGEWFVTEAEHQPTHPYDLHVKINNGKVVSYPVQRIRSTNKTKYTIEDSKKFPCLCKLLEYYCSKELPNTDNTIRQAFSLFGTVVTEV